MQQGMSSSAVDESMCFQTLKTFDSGGTMGLESINSRRACVTHEIYALLEIRWQSSFSSCWQIIGEARSHAL